MFSQMVSCDFLLDEPLHGYILYLVCASPEKPTKRCEPEEGYLRCSKPFDHGSHSIHHYTSLSSSQLHRDFFRFFFFSSQKFFILKRQTRDGGKYGIWKICSRATQNLGTCKYFKKNQTFFFI